MTHDEPGRQRLGLLGPGRLTFPELIWRHLVIGYLLRRLREQR